MKLLSLLHVRLNNATLRSSGDYLALFDPKAIHLKYSTGNLPHHSNRSKAKAEISAGIKIYICHVLVTFISHTYLLACCIFLTDATGYFSPNNK